MLDLRPAARRGSKAEQLALQRLGAATQTEPAKDRATAAEKPLHLRG